jgi:plasmid stability protein
MATLHVRNVPDKLYKRIQKRAEQEKRSLTAEVIQLLTRGLQAHEARGAAAAVVGRIRQNARKRSLPRDWVDSVELIREDRAR